MSGSFVIVGLFGLANSRRVRTPKVNNPNVGVFHAFYNTAIQFPNGPSLAVELRIWSPHNDVIHPDETVALVIAKAFVPSVQDSSNVALLEAYYIYAFPVR
jgi:hypothetical protein